MSAGTHYHRCGRPIWQHHDRTGKLAFVDPQAHKAITHCPGCGDRLEARDLTREKPEPSPAEGGR